jgi:hypothetical protein
MNKEIFPDENYAREIMQLFSIGLYQLNIDGTPVLDAQGQPIQTYDNDEISKCKVPIWTCDMRPVHNISYMRYTVMVYLLHQQSNTLHF